MPLRPEDVVRKNFNNTARFRGGYVSEEVDTFLEEVVAELRRLNALVDEQQAEVNHLKSARPDDSSGYQLGTEQIQLAHVRKERNALVAEMENADRRIAEAQQAAALAEEAKELSLEEIRARFDDDLLKLEQKVNTVRADANAAVDDSKKRIAVADQLAQAAERHAAQLREKLAKVSADVRAAATEHLGADVVEELIPFGDGLETDAIAQSSMVAMLADRIRRDHLTSGQHEAERLLGEAALERESIIAEGHRGLEQAQDEAAALIAAAREEGDDARETARISSERLLAEAQRQQTALLDQAQRDYDERVRLASSEATKLMEHAQLERDAILADLATRREALEARVTELDTSAREYRERVRALVNHQLIAIDKEDWDR
ncbi:DivIVA domain-containing protein [Ornithinimicrobium cryptoxanthini]|uniref:Cell wall synthesis protein Wag31 n=1 Tax=Ornithinimicrobium cryptoxanthini TaxID=2934161 RepID=A0ABY4YKZ6_9MICO|nr:DivIVA domain-containing protein [Ornithinimicrobium cryptoxanthini]USQ77470.1 DivIVA domain-containing protein [Ornithinimicrobium cryptoxanthini]